MPLETLEVRWFGEGAVTGATWDWFTALHGPAYLRTEERSDSYVVLPGVTDLGIKWRGEVSFDLKARRREVGEIRLDGGASPILGRVEEWIKWAYPLDANTALARTISRLPMVPVGKMRVQYMFDVSDGAEPPSRPVPVSPEGEFPRVGLALFLELAGILCKERFAWSLAIEGSAALGSKFEEAVQVVADGIPRGPLQLVGATSGSYPTWLNSLFPSSEP
jgi:hypothetical protein